MMKRTLEKIAVLSLSLLLVSTYAVSSVVPKMLEHFSTYSREQVELLISIPSLGIAFMILANIWLSRILKERVSIVLGAALIVLSAFFSMKVDSYIVFFLARLLLGLGIGLINARAITMIQNRYKGKELSSLLGIRGSMEVLGSTFMTFLAGRLMHFGWNMVFAVYLLVIPVLLLYLLFVREGEEAQVEDKKVEQVSSKDYLPYIFLAFLLGFAFINTNVSTTMRMASFMKEMVLGTETDASVLLSYMQMTGVVAGLVFSRLFRWMGKKTMVFSLFCMGLGLLLVSHASSVFLLYCWNLCRLCQWYSRHHAFPGYFRRPPSRTFRYRNFSFSFRL